MPLITSLMLYGMTSKGERRRRDNVEYRIYRCFNCGRVRIHGGWRYMTKQEEQDIIGRKNVVWLRRDECLGCYQLVNNSKNEKEGKL